MRVFDSDKILVRWRDSGAFPAIHDDIMCLVGPFAPRDAPTLDLCCSTGILGQQLQDRFGMRAYGVELDEAAIAKGRAHGITLPITPMRIGPDTIGHLLVFLLQHEIKTVVARRCLSELLAPCLEFGATLSECFRQAGVDNLFLEGRAITSRATHPVPSVAHEIAALGAGWNVKARYRQSAWMVPA